MKIDFPQPSPRRASPTDVPRDGMENSSRASSATRAVLLLALLLACGGTSEETPSEPTGCTSDAECTAGQQCIDSACAAPSPPASKSAGVFACSVIQCPEQQPNCCTAAEASATGNENQNYVVRNVMVQRAFSFPGEVRADFSFDASDQQGWITFQFDTELDLEHVDFAGRGIGVADQFLSVNTNRADGNGCAFGFELEFRPPPNGQGPFVRGNDNIFLNDGDFCYGQGRPGRARELAFAIFSMQPGDASLIITDIRLRE